MRPFRDPSLRFVAGASALTLVIAGAALALGASSPEIAAPPTTVPPPPAPDEVACPDAAGDIDALRECLSQSLVFIETPVGVGSGVVLETGEIVTNAHVVGPFDRVDVTFVGGRSIDDVEVVGVEAQDDIAVLAPVSDVEHGLTLAPLPAQRPDTPDDVYLMGYPLGAEGDRPEVSITQGVISRTRAAKEFDQLFLQTDAVIFGGQSGGALFDGRGQLLGISGYSYYVFSLSLSADDVIEAVDSIRAGNGDDRVVMPDAIEDWNETTEVLFPDNNSIRRLLVPGTADRRTATLTVDTKSSYTVDVTDLFGGPIASYWGDDDYGFGDEVDGDWFVAIDDPFGYGLSIEPDDDGALTFDLPKDTPVLVDISLRPKAKVDITFDVPYMVADGVVTADSVAVGESVHGVVDAVNGRTSHAVEVEEGDEIAITLAGSPVIPTFTLYSPDDHPLQGFNPYAYGGGSGLGMIDAPITRRFKINKSGTFTIVVESPIVGAYDLTVERV